MKGANLNSSAGPKGEGQDACSNSFRYKLYFLYSVIFVLNYLILQVKVISRYRLRATSGLARGTLNYNIDGAVQAGPGEYWASFSACLRQISMVWGQRVWNLRPCGAWSKSLSQPIYY